MGKLGNAPELHDRQHAKDRLHQAKWERDRAATDARVMPDSKALAAKLVRLEQRVQVRQAELDGFDTESE